MKKLNTVIFLSAFTLLSACATTETNNMEQPNTPTSNINAQFEKEMTDKNWKLVKANINGENVNLSNATITLLFQDGRLAGSSAINRYSGPITVGDDQSISFSGPLIMTRMAGPENLMTLEQKYISAINEINKYEINNNILKLYTPDNSFFEFEATNQQ